ncbi:hypothetical protein KY363_06685 [Candidatus Woesearchaeota archaeon]|nr:hypothetical protein [Candidatus Woesearchaeota archaeon]
MVKLDTKKVKLLKQQDKELSRLPTIDKEKRVFSKGESLLKKLSVRKKIRFNPKMLSKPKQQQMKRLKSKVGKKSRTIRRKRG